MGNGGSDVRAADDGAEQGVGLIDGASAPRDVLVGADQHQVGAVERVELGQVDERERDPGGLGRRGPPLDVGLRVQPPSCISQRGIVKCTRVASGVSPRSRQPSTIRR